MTALTGLTRLTTWRRRSSWLAMLLAAFVFIGGSFIASGGAQAAPVTASVEAGANATMVATAPTYGVPHEISKVILPATSADGPALWTQRGPSYPVGPLAVLAWTKTTGQLAYEATNDGVTFFGQTTLAETSFVRPAVVRGTGEGAVVAPIALAWTGTDAGHHLNVRYAVPGASPLKLTLWQDNSFTSPALEWFNSTTLLLAWAGTDAGHALNVLPVSITDHGLVPGTKTTLWTFHSAGQPALITDYSVTPTPGRFFLGWSDMTSHRLAWAVSPDGKTWTPQSPFNEWSGAGPSMMGLNEQLAHMPPYWLGWTGLDAAHHVNVQYALTLGQWPTTSVKATLPETAVGGTVVGFFLSMHDNQMLVAWTGTDAAHHLNVAWIGV